MILLEPAYEILHTTVKFKRRTISVTSFFGVGGFSMGQFSPNGYASRYLTGRFVFP
jgi:hypothetical protein